MKPVPTPTPTPTPTPHPIISGLSAQDYFDAGVSHGDSGNYALALTAFNNAIALEPDIGDYYWFRGSAYHGLGQFVDAINDFDISISMNQGTSLVYIDYRSRGDSYYELGLYGLAIEDYTDAINLQPDYAYAYYSRSEAYRAMGNTDQADSDQLMACSLDTVWGCP